LAYSAADGWSEKHPRFALKKPAGDPPAGFFKAKRGCFSDHPSAAEYAKKAEATQ